MSRVVEMADHPQVGIYFDIGNLTAEGFDTPSQLRAVGEGNVDMPAIADAVRDIRYDGWLVFGAAATHNLAELRT